MYFFITLLLAFIAMEGVAWAAHKYVMHGFLWHLHQDHHTKKSNSFFEKNDYFFVLFAIPGICFIILGTLFSSPYAFAIGLGITLYGVTYFFIHEVFIHQRFKFFRNTNNKYLKAIRRAHKTHHKYTDKEHGECFGMLWIPIKYFKK